MHVEGSSISCGVRRLVIGKTDVPSQKELSALIKTNKGSCAMLVTAIPTRCKDIKELLLKNDFEQIKNFDGKYILDPSVKSVFAKIASLIMNHERPIIEDSPDIFESFVNNTVNNDLSETAIALLHHGAFVGSLNLFVRYMN